MIRRFFPPLLAIVCTVSVLSAQPTNLRARLKALYSPDEIARGVYVGTEFCLMCHSGLRGKDCSAWRATQHAASYIRPMQQWTLVPGKGVLANTLAKPADDFVSGLDFNAISSAFDNYKPIAPKLGVKNGTYTITIGPMTMPVAFVLQWRGPSGGWEQLYCVRVPVSDSPTGSTDAVYSSPLFFTTDDGWEPYSPEAWYDDSGQPRYPAAAKTADIVANCESHDQNCVGCHTMAVRSMSQNARGEWVFTGYPAVVYDANNPSYFDYRGDGNFVVMNIGCESCHGPGSNHIVGNGDKNAIVNPAKLDPKSSNEVCGQCHAVIASVPAGTFGWPWDETANRGWFPGSGTPLANSIQDAGVWWPDNKTGMDTSQYPEMNKSAKETNSFHPVRCTECHSAMLPTTNNAQVIASMTSGNVTFPTSASNNTLCLGCHATHGPFENITKEQVADYANQLYAIGQVVRQHTHHPYAPDRTVGLSRCTECHMAMTQGPDSALALHGHTFEPISPQKTLLYQDQGGMPNSCALSCHASRVDILGLGMTSDLHTFDKPFDVALAKILQSYYGPGGVWWNVDVTKSSNARRTATHASSTSRPHHRTPGRSIQ